ncbi:MAG: HIT family protein [Pseudomonadota bacterium]
MRDQPKCVFCDVEQLEVIAENSLAFAIRDKFPVKPLHTLVLPRRHCRDVFETTAAEREAMHALAQVCIANLKTEDPTIKGVNYGSNIRAVAGQKIFHTHIHIIPRRAGDMDPPAARG